MCGIVGIIGTDRRPYPSLVAAMALAIQHRGPDSEGTHATRIAEVGIRRLAIVDLREGDQPIFNEAGDLAVVFNGEIYNYQELRAWLEQRGHRFATRTDTEVIVHLFEEEGEECVHRLHGMFAFAVVGQDEVFLARDRLGIKPLFLTYVRDGRLLLFASEIKALLRCADVDVSLDQTYLADRMVLRYPTRPHTIFRNIQSLPPGHSLRIRDNNGVLDLVERRYYRVSVDAPPEEDFEPSARRVHDVLLNAVRTHIHADVDVGLALSGGVDSSLLACLVRSEAPRMLRTFTVACNPDASDRVTASRLARAMACQHDEILPSFNDYVEAIPRFVWADEDAASLYGLPFHLLCRGIGRIMKVCLDGEGADEMFGGYWTHTDWKPTITSLEKMLAWARAAELPVSDRALTIVETLRRPRTYAEYIPVALQILQEDQLEFNHLAGIDRHAMAASLEIRVPFLDDFVVETVNRLPVPVKLHARLGISRYVLKRLLLELGGALTHDVALRSKFGMPTAGAPYRQQFVAICERSISDDYAIRHPYSHFLCRRAADGRIHGKEDVLLFDLFEQIFVRDRGSLSSLPRMSDFMADRSMHEVAIRCQKEA